MEIIKKTIMILPKITLLPFFLIFFVSSSIAECIKEIQTISDSGFQEVVIIVGDADKEKETWIRIGKYEEICLEKSSHSLHKLWNLKEDVRINEILLRKGNINRSFIRLVSIEGNKNKQLRSSGMPWDNGGYFDLYHYVDDVDKIFNELKTRGWQAYNDPIEYELQIFKIKEVIMRGPNGEVLCLMERKAPAYDKKYAGSETGISWPFNIVTVVSDYESNINFFKNILGWHVYLNGESSYPEPGYNPSGIPANLAQTLKQRFTRFSQSKGDGAGSIQVLKNDGLVGRDFSKDLNKPLLGLYATRYIVTNIDQLLKRIIDNKYSIESRVQDVNLSPYGLIKTLTVLTPSNARIEFFEVIGN